MRPASHVNEIAVITGTTHGIGRATARELARAGRTVVMLCRDLTLAADTQREIEQRVPDARIHAIRCDLSSLTSVCAAADEVRSRFETIHILINDAGIVSSRHRMSTDGFELTFATNHLGPFLLTQPRLRRLP
jgi:NAD(P)-dependent dehydrogenase (short-subunit alcohol dehydrogenase family)